MPLYRVPASALAAEPVVGDADDDRVLVPGIGPTLQPVDQVRGYCLYLRDFVAVLAEPAHSELTGAAYLHNMATADGEWLADRVQDEHGRLFTAATRGGFVSYLKERLDGVGGASAADDFPRSAVRPSQK